MSGNISISASTARKLAHSAFEGAEETRNKGYEATANKIESCADSILDVASEDKGSQSVSVNPYELSRITAYGSGEPSSIARELLEEHGVWN